MQTDTINICADCISEATWILLNTIEEIMHKFTDTANADRNTVHTTMNDTLSNTPPREYPVKTYDNLYVQEDFGTLDYPVAVSYLDLSKSYMNRIRWHWHEEMEILIINNGFAEVVTDDASYPLKPGRIFNTCK